MWPAIIKSVVVELVFFKEYFLSEKKIFFNWLASDQSQWGLCWCYFVWEFLALSLHWLQDDDAEDVLHCHLPQKLLRVYVHKNTIPFAVAMVWHMATCACSSALKSSTKTFVLRTEENATVAHQQRQFPVKDAFVHLYMILCVVHPTLPTPVIAH